MNYLEEQIVDELRVLPLDKQQEVLDFIECLKAKLTLKVAESSPPSDKPLLFGDVADKYAGCLDGGPEDLSTNKSYMQGFGQR